MRIARKLVIFLLVISTMLLLLSYFLPYFEVSTKTEVFKDLNKEGFAMYEMTQYPFTILFILLPILGMVFMSGQSKLSENLSLSFYLATFVSNIFYMLSTNKALLDGTFKYSSGMILFLIATIAIGLCSLYLITIELLVKISNGAIVEVNSDTLRKSLERLNKLKEQNFITDIEYEEKRADLVRQLKI